MTETQQFIESEFEQIAKTICNIFSFVKNDVAKYNALHELEKLKRIALQSWCDGEQND